MPVLAPELELPLDAPLEPEPASDEELEPMPASWSDSTPSGVDDEEPQDTMKQPATPSVAAATATCLFTSFTDNGWESDAVDGSCSCLGAMILSQ